MPIFVPHTPRGFLANAMREKEAQNNQGRKIRFKIVERGGVTLEQKLRRSNPWAGGECGRPRCFPCRGDGGNCSTESITYTLWCEECGDEVAAYKGESGRNAYSRGIEHLEYLEANDEDKSVLWLHSIHHHQRRRRPTNKQQPTIIIYGRCLCSEGQRNQTSWQVGKTRGFGSTRRSSEMSEEKRIV